jgi:cobalt-zinc-cadmium resistance protein CzcA
MQRFKYYILISKFTFFLLLFHLFAWFNVAQSNDILKLSLSQVVDSTIKNHPLLRNGGLKISLAHAQTSVNIEPLQFSFTKGQLLSAATDRRLEFIQPLGSPLQWKAKANLNKSNINIAEAENELLQRQIIAKVKQAYFECVYTKEKFNLLKSQIEKYSDIFEDSLYYTQNDEKSVFEKSIIAYRIADLESQSDEAYNNLIIARNNLVHEAFLYEEAQPLDSQLIMFEIEVNSDTSTRTPANIFKKYYRSKYNSACAKVKAEGSKFSPEFHVGYFNQSVNGKNGFYGLQLGVNFRLWALPQINAYKASKTEKQIAENELVWQTAQLEATTANLIAELNKYFDRLNYFNDYSLNSADFIEDTMVKKFERKLIDANAYIQSIDMAYKIRLDYIETLRKYNYKAIELEVYAY